MSLTNQVYITSLAKAIEKSKLDGKLDTRIIYLYGILDEYEKYTANLSQFAEENLFIRNEMLTLKYRNNNVICSTSEVLPKGSYLTYNDGSGSGGAGGSGENAVSTNPTLSPFTVGTVYRRMYSNSTALYFTYRFNINDFLNNYSDLDGNTFFQVRINRTNLDGGLLYYEDGTDSVYLPQDASSITILASDISNLYYFTDDEIQTSHGLTVSVIDKDRFGNLWVSNTVTMTVDKTGQGTDGNLPATIGDQAIKVGNQTITTLTLAMFTSGLTPPYNDPEADLIDAIRIDEISTANVGEFRYNGTPLITGQIITREELEAGLFTHAGANSNDIETDSFNFSARDEGSGIWIK